MNNPTKDDLEYARLRVIFEALRASNDFWVALTEVDDLPDLKPEHAYGISVLFDELHGLAICGYAAYQDLTTDPPVWKMFNYDARGNEHVVLTVPID